METIGNKLIAWLQQLGVSQTLSRWILVLAALLLLVLSIVLVLKICRMTLVPLIRRVTDRTATKWDDYLLSDEVLDNACHLVPPVLLSVFLPMILPVGEDLMWLVNKGCNIYPRPVSGCRGRGRFLLHYFRSRCCRAGGDAQLRG